MMILNELENRLGVFYYVNTDVVRNPKTKFRSPSSYKTLRAKTLTTSHIAAHLQDTQNPQHISQPYKRAAIANTRQTPCGSTR